MTNEAGRLRERATAAARSGDSATASKLFREAVKAAPRDTAILNSAASHHSRLGNRAEAIELLRTAVAVNPDAAEPLLNLALLLAGNGHPDEALELLLPREAQLATMARYWSIRAGAERAAGKKCDALESYSRAATLDPSNARAIEGRARLSLETGLDAVAHYRAALAVAPGTATAVLGYGQALEASGDLSGATAVAEQIVAQLPSWTEGLEWLAQLRWASGDRDGFTRHYSVAVASAGEGKSHVFESWCKMLAGVDRYAEAAAVAANARKALGDLPRFALREAVHLGEAGDEDRAEGIFQQLRLDTPERKVQESRHWLRRRDPARAEVLLSQVLEHEPENVAAWALRDIGWRLAGDPRHDWLHGQPGLITAQQMALPADRLERIVAFLDNLHDQSAMPVGQSVREGSQTRGGLFDRHEPEVGWIEEAYREAVEAYGDGLPDMDPDHPLLRNRNATWTFAGSWSIRVLRGGRHTEHIHPQGLLSSAAYFVVPQSRNGEDPQAGWLELGRPPPDLRLDLPPLCSIEPQPGRCALFPSTLYHGTRKFTAGKRMTVAIDVQVKRHQ